MITAFEDFVNAELPRRPVMLSLDNTGYSGDPNASVAPIINNAPKGSFFLNDADNVLWKKNDGTSTSWEEVGTGGGFTFTVIDGNEDVTIPVNTSMLYAEDITILDGNLTIEGDVTPVKDAENFSPHYVPLNLTRVVPETDIVYYDPNDFVVDGNLVVDGDIAPMPVADGGDVLDALTDIAPTSSIVGTSSSVTDHLTPAEARTVMDVLSTSEVTTAAKAAVTRFSSLTEEAVTTGPHAAEVGKLYRYEGDLTFTLPASPVNEDTIGFWSANSANILTLDGNGNSVRTADNFGQSIKTIYLNLGLGFAVFRNGTWYFVSDGISAWFSEQLPYMMLGTDASGLPVTTKFGDPYLALSETAVSTATTVVGELYATVRFLVNSASARTLQLPASPNEGDRAGFQHWGAATNQVAVTLDGNGENIESLFSPLTTAASFVAFLQGSFYVACRYNGTNWVIESQSGTFDSYVYGATLAGEAVGHTDSGGGTTRTEFSADDAVFGKSAGGALGQLLPYSLTHVAEQLAQVSDTATGLQSSWLPGGAATAWNRSSGVDWAGVASIIIQGLQENDTNGEFVPTKVIRNNQSDPTLVMQFRHEDAAAAATERIITPGESDFNLRYGDAVYLHYDSGASRWVILASQTAGLFGTGTNRLMAISDTNTLLEVSVGTYQVVGRTGTGSIGDLTMPTLDNILYSLASRTVATSSVTGTQNDFAPQTAVNWRQAWRCALNPGTALTVTGFAASPASIDFGLRKWIVNGGTATITLNHEDSGSTAANRITTPDGQPYEILPGYSVYLFYDEAAGRWKPISDSQGRATQVARATGVTELLDATVTTTDATVTTIATFSTLANDTTSRFKFQIQALETSTGDAALFDVSALGYRNTGGSVSIKDLAFLNGPFRDQGAWNVTLNVSTQDIQIQVTGEAAKTIKWRINGHVQED